MDNGVSNKSFQQLLSDAVGKDTKLNKAIDRFREILEHTDNKKITNADYDEVFEGLPFFSIGDIKTNIKGQKPFIDRLRKASDPVSSLIHQHVSDDFRKKIEKSYNLKDGIKEEEIIDEINNIIKQDILNEDVFRDVTSPECIINIGNHCDWSKLQGEELLWCRAVCLEDVYRNEIDKTDGILSILASFFNKTTNLFFKEEFKLIPKHQAFSFSINSLIIAGGRYLCQLSSASDLCGFRIEDPEDETKKLNNSEWSAIGYRYLLQDILKEGSPRNITHGIGELQEVKKNGKQEGKDASLYSWFIRLEQPPRSITITFEPPPKKEELTREGSNVIESLDGLKPWQEVTDIETIHDKHMIVRIPYFKDEDNVYTGGAYFNKLTEYKYCGDPRSFQNESWIAARVMESIASVLLDFQLLSRDLPPDYDKMKSVDQVKQVTGVLNQFLERWFDPRKVYYFNDANGFNAFPDKKTENYAAILPEAYKERIKLVYLAAQKLLDRKTITFFLPRYWIALNASTLLKSNHNDAVSKEAEAPGNVMFFSDQLHPGSLLDLFMIKLDKTFQTIRAEEQEWITARDVKKATEVIETMNRRKAIAGYSHQAGHVFGNKSNFDILSLVERTTITDENVFKKLVDIWPIENDDDKNELKAREAQIRYAAVTTSIVSIMLNQELFKLNIFDFTGNNRDKTTKELKPFLNEVGDQMVIPLIRQISKSIEDYGCRTKDMQIIYNIQNVKGLTPLLPYNELTKAIFFEMFWNAFRHGSWEGRNAIVEVTVSIETGRGKKNKVIIQIKNPHDITAGPSGSVNGLSFIKSFANALASMKNDDGAACSNVCSFTPKYDEKSYWTELSLPFIKKKEVVDGDGF